MNRWNIPEWLKDEVVERDRKCVYCGVSFRKSDAPFRERPSWEHIVNDATMISRDNIAVCCLRIEQDLPPKLILHATHAGARETARRLYADRKVGLINRARRHLVNAELAFIEGRPKEARGSIQSAGSHRSRAKDRRVAWTREDLDGLDEGCMRKATHYRGQPECHRELRGNFSNDCCSRQSSA